MGNRTKRRHANHMRGERGVEVARRLFPPQWVVREVNPDYGLDLHIEVFDEAADDPESADALGEHFYAQVKSVEEFAAKTMRVYSRSNVAKYTPRNDRGQAREIEVIPYSMESPEIRTVEEMGTAVPVLLILASRTTGEARYICLNDWISKVLLPSKPDYTKQDSVTVHVPAWNRLNPERPDFTYIWLLARRSKFYAAFSSFHYQHVELSRAAASAGARADAGVLFADACREAAIPDMLNAFVHGALRLGIWRRTGRGWWSPLGDVHGDMTYLQHVMPVLQETTDDEEAYRLLERAVQTFRRADNLGIMYEEVCREWRLPTDLAATIETAEQAEIYEAEARAQRGAEP